MATSAISAPIDNTPNPASIALARALDMERETIDFTERIYGQVTEDRDREREVRDTLRIIQYIEGEQWKSGTRYARHRPVVNKMRRHFWESVGMLTDLSLDFQVKMFDKLNGFSDFERMINQLLVRWAMSNEVRYSQAQYDVVLYGILHTGPAKIQWNSRLNGGMGDMQMVPIAPWEWGCLGAGSNPQDSECIVYFPTITQDYIARRYGRKLAERVTVDPGGGGNLRGQFHRPPKISAEVWARMGEGLRRSLGVRSSSAASDDVYPTLTLKEFWLRDNSINDTSRTVTVGPHDVKGEPTVNWAYRVEPGQELYPRGRVVVQGGGVVFEDNPNPYWHSMFPFPTFRPFRVPWRLSGDMIGKGWMQMQNITNRIMGGVLDMVHAIIEPTLIAPKGAFPSADWDALDPGAFGGKIKYNNNAPKGPEFAKRAEIPGWVFSYLQEISKEWDLGSGASAMQQALSKKQVPGEDSLDMILSSRSLPVKVETRALADFIEEGGMMVIASMLQFYTVAHRIAILGAEGISSADYKPIYGEARPEGMMPEEFVRKFMGVVRRDTLLNSQKEKKIGMAIALLKMGKLSDRRFFELVDQNFPYEMNKKELLEEARIRILVAAAAGAATGKTQHKGGK